MSVIYPEHFRDRRLEGQGLVREAENLIPLLRERAEEAERLRRLPEQTCKALRETGLPRLLQPRRFGGAEASLEHLVDVMIPIATGPLPAGTYRVQTALRAWSEPEWLALDAEANVLVR